MWSANLLRRSRIGHTTTPLLVKLQPKVLVGPVPRTWTHTANFSGLALSRGALFSPNGLSAHINHLPLRVLPRCSSSSFSAGSVTSSPTIGEAQSLQSPANTSTPPPTGGKFQNLIREYGLIGAFVYATTTFVLFSANYLFIQYSGVDVTPILDKFKEIKGWLTGTAPGDEPQEGDLVEKSADNGKPRPLFNLTTMFMAMALTKVFFPVKLPFVLTVTPYIARWARARGIVVGQQGIGAREAVKEVVRTRKLPQKKATPAGVLPGRRKRKVA
ncbi:hypothetical protein M427DRAFT_56233 [Gonapodya prolifera JEL478]|uniref:DUF1279 domain-containing protein n=1 Tax=Gonapodya prolifera (strain JEL478) TaxID=1344416 RepID=A0A139AGL6_GONPJ|nr:hypothetical protein M427DRAFT_56233 [Gonapodya prolifera JEL478]|eukprot:KXS15927.1 hypothetical protein M427DRAFT_56233 [Gonapodya prolifera JEL478]